MNHSAHSTLARVADVEEACDERTMIDRRTTPEGSELSHPIDLGTESDHILINMVSLSTNEVEPRRPPDPIDTRCTRTDARCTRTRTRTHAHTRGVTTGHHAAQATTATAQIGLLEERRAALGGSLAMRPHDDTP